MVWSGPDRLYGFWAARLSGARLVTALLQALAVSIVGVVLFVLKALVH